MVNADKSSNLPQDFLNVVDNVVDRPYTVQRLVENPIEKIVDKPVTMERIVERLVVDTVDKVVDKPASVSRIVERPIVTVVERSSTSRCRFSALSNARW